MRQDIVLHEVSSPVASRNSPRIEVYCGAKEHLRVSVGKDNNAGEAAVLRNMNVLCPPSPTSPCRLVVTDRFYTSVKLALELLHCRMYLTGTIQTVRSGYAKYIITKKKTRIVNKQKVMVPSQGTTKLAENKRFPQLTAVMWMDRLPVHMLSTGGSRRPSTVSMYASSLRGEFVYPKVRRVHGDIKAVPAPELVRDYHRWMGVDVHDQLRMQRYNVQLAYKTRKYYKTLFLGLYDMALVNAFIVHRYFRKVNNKRPPKHFAFLETLMEQLLAVDSPVAFDSIERATSAKERTAASPARDGSTQHDILYPADTDHRLAENPDTVDCEQGTRRRHRSCKVCAILKMKPRKFTKYFCPEFSTGNRRTYLSNVAREGKDKTCFQIWHADWSDGNDVPCVLLQEHKIRNRPPPSRPGKKRRQIMQARHRCTGRDGVGVASSERRNRVGQDKQKEYSDKNGRGNLNVLNKVVSSVESNKLIHRFIGHFAALARHGAAYTIALPKSMATHPTFYVGRLKRYYDPLGPSPQTKTKVRVHLFETRLNPLDNWSNPVSEPVNGKQTGTHASHTKEWEEFG
ncbi:LOW QUALITY PROTEIN: Hypothetical protein PHPALM_36399 [Phytophthora palmivora]|uniref:Uncharacterized protein n=1 Tax=Phytophthora palmivora TaxID=4796 RepID=A0A2P4X015_9STRA|nr:LOW QUALITY PROTEIN: Hypothetical protein PHPALM_36399 [Phytophthora palmivora]